MSATSEAVVVPPQGCDSSDHKQNALEVKEPLPTNGIASAERPSGWSVSVRSRPAIEDRIIAHHHYFQYG
jgi:hypothetical protein